MTSGFLIQAMGKCPPHLQIPSRICAGGVTSQDRPFWPLCGDLASDVDPLPRQSRGIHPHRVDQPDADCVRMAASHQWPLAGQEKPSAGSGSASASGYHEPAACNRHAAGRPKSRRRRLSPPR